MSEKSIKISTWMIPLLVGLSTSAVVSYGSNKAVAATMSADVKKAQNDIQELEKFKGSIWPKIAEAEKNIAVINKGNEDINRRLTNIEQGQAQIDNKIDLLLMRRE